MVQTYKKPDIAIADKLADGLIQSLKDLPKGAQEPIVDTNFIATSFFDALGFSLQERIREFKTGSGTKTVDYALRHNITEVTHF